MIEIVRDAARFAALGPEWNEVLQSSSVNGPFLTWEWLHSWWIHLRERRRLRLLLVRDGGRLIGIAPLALLPFDARRLQPFRALQFLGTGSAGSDDLDLIVRRGAEEQVVDEIVRQLDGLRTVLQLAPLRAGPGPAMRLASRLHGRRWHGVEIEAGVCPGIDLSGLSWDRYLAGRGREHRYAFRRKLRRLHERFYVGFTAVRTEEERREALAALDTMHRRRWAGEGGSDAFGTPSLRAFHDTATCLMLERGWLRLRCLKLNGDIAAVVYGFQYGGQCCFYQIGSGYAYDRWSVGFVALGLSIREAIEEGASAYDFLHGAEAYKLHWAGSMRALRCLELYPPRLAGVLHRQLATASRVTRRTTRHGLAPAVRAVAALRRRLAAGTWLT